MSNPWLNVMPGGVPFAPRPEDDDDDWGFGAPGDPVGEAGEVPVEVPLVDIPDVEAPEGNAPIETPTAGVPASGVVPSPVTHSPQQVHVPAAVPVHAEGFTPHPVLVSTNVDTPVPAVPVAPVAPVEETPGWAAWGDWDDEPATPSRPSALDALAPGRWASPLPEEAPALAAEQPTAPVPPAVPPVTDPVAVPSPVAVPEVAPVPVTGHPLPQPHPSVPPMHDPVLPPTPAPAPAPAPAADPAPVPAPAPAPAADPAPVPPAADPVAHPVVFPPASPTIPSSAPVPEQVAVPVPSLPEPTPVTPVITPTDVAPVDAEVSVEGYVPEGYSVDPHTGELTSLAQPTTQPPVEAPVQSPVEASAPVVAAESDNRRVPPEGYWLNPFTLAVEPKPVTDTTPEAPAPVTEPVPVLAPSPVAHPVTHPATDTATGTVGDDDTEGDSEGGSTSLLAKVESVEELLEADEDFSDVEEAEAAAEAAAKAEKQRQSRATRPVAVTDRDVAVLQFLARYRMATYPQLAAAFGISYTALRHRMPRLAREGLVVRKAIGKSTYSVWMPTDAGMKVADMDLTLPTLSWATVGHTLGLVDVGIRFEALGEVVVTEREIRAADTRDLPTDRMQQAAEMTGFTGEQARLYVVEMGDGTKQYAHIPDMVLARPPAENGGARSVAVELELNHKPAAQWRKILAAYRNAPHISQVIYFTHQSKVRSGILAAAKEVGAEHMVKVRKFEPSEDSAIPLPGRA